MNKKQILQSFVLCFCALIFMACTKKKKLSKEGAFSFHLLAQPHSLDPRQVQGAAGSFLFSQLHRTLYKWQNTSFGPNKTNQHRLVPDGAKKCTWLTKLRLKCELKHACWSDGSLLTAHDYVRGIKRILCLKSVHAEHLLNIKGVRAVLNSQTQNPSACTDPKVGVYAQSDAHLIFEFDQHDPEFLYKTLSHALSPLKKHPIKGVNFSQAFKTLTPRTASSLIVSGPYKIKKWIKNKRLYLEPNTYYQNAHPKLAKGAKAAHCATSKAKTKASTKVPVEILFVEDDTAAMNLFETGRLSLLRRIPVDDLPRWQGHKHFFTVPLERFDYIGFGPRLSKWPQLTRAMALALDYTAFQKILRSFEPIGCPSFAANFMSPPVCLKFDLKQAKLLLQRVPLEVRQKTYTFVYSQMGGRSVLTGLEWLEHQWKKHLNLRIKLQPLEQGVFLSRLKHNVPDIFRKGGALHRPTCLAGLELFKSSAPENYIQLNDKNFDALLNKTALKLNGSAQQKARLCSQAVQSLINTGRVIPLGRIHYGMLRSNKFTGWSINSLQQLDLTGLTGL